LSFLAVGSDHVVTAK